MGRRRPMPAGAVEQLSRLLKEAKTQGQFQRIQCVWFRAALGMSSEEVARRHPGEAILLVLLGAGWHRAKDLNVPENIRLVPLPPYSPELNPVEHVWEELRENWFQTVVFNSIDAVEDRLVEALVTLENDRSRVSNITAFPWINRIPMTAT